MFINLLFFCVYNFFFCQCGHFGYLALDGLYRVHRLNKCIDLSVIGRTVHYYINCVGNFLKGVHRLGCSVKHRINPFFQFVEVSVALFIFCIVWYGFVLFFTILYYSLLFCTILYDFVLLFTIRHYSVLFVTVRYFSVLTGATTCEPACFYMQD